MLDTAQTPSLTRQQKAAIVVQMLLRDGASLKLAQLPETLQEQLALQLAALRTIDKATMKSVAQDFVLELETIGLIPHPNVDAALEKVSPHLSPALVERLRNPKEAEQSGIWERIKAFGDNKLLQILSDESLTVSAIVLSKLPNGQAATLLKKLPGPRARRIALSLARTESVGTATVTSIGQAILRSYADDQLPVFQQSPATRLGKILNLAEPDTRDALLNALVENDPDFASTVRREIFTFGDIPARLSPADVSVVTKELAAETIAATIAAAKSLSPEAQEAKASAFIIANLPKRLAAQLEESAAEMGEITGAEADAVFAKVAAALQTLAETGDITFLPPTDG